MSDQASLHAIVYGRVQGVFFRAFVSRQAKELGLTGYVRNLPNGEIVEVRAEGKRERLEKLIDRLKMGSPAARVDKVVTEWSAYMGSYVDFSIRY